MAGETYYPVVIRLPIIAHGYTCGFEELRRLTQHLVGDDIRGYEQEPDPLDAIDGGIEEDEKEEEDPFLTELLDVEWAFSLWIENTSAERNIQIPELWPIKCTAKEEREHKRRMKKNKGEQRNDWPQRFMLVTHKSKPYPTGKVKDNARVESEQTKKKLDEFLSLVVPNAPEVLSPKDFTFTHVPLDRVICTNIFLKHIPLVK
ncbi:hypothetical protein FISHEDRAFT_74653 [Fistulina hepatica ATCC 64428]|uniref:Uncharacterized protein n=1 Tax=Fistulina hepatica ATCC 64428 TaxID=1128425 RepID=A0A0D7ABY7_9AGAR|nr:hypothetical protein FISHEDRAFT_74653 [Fistulina hepatica ATCC 64428]